MREGDWSLTIQSGIAEREGHMEQLNRIQIIKRYFERDGGRPVSLQEMKELTREDRVELADLAAKELDVEIKEVN